MTAVSGQQSAAEENLRALFGQSIAVFAELAGPAHVVEAANPAFFAAIGEERARTGLPLAELAPELGDSGFHRAAGRGLSLG